MHLETELGLTLSNDTRRAPSDDFTMTTRVDVQNALLIPTQLREADFGDGIPRSLIYPAIKRSFVPTTDAGFWMTYLSEESTRDDEGWKPNVATLSQLHAAFDRLFQENCKVIDRNGHPLPRTLQLGSQVRVLLVSRKRRLGVLWGKVNRISRERAVDDLSDLEF